MKCENNIGEKWKLMSPAEVLGIRFQDAIGRAFAESLDEDDVIDPLIREAQNPKFGDYQSNVAMSLAKRLGKNPREIAQAIVESLEVDDICADKPTIAGAGFINLTIKNEALASMLTTIDNQSLGITSIDKTKTHRVVIDMVSVNVAKQMHVGHLRSAIIGDTLCRVLSRVGYEVIPQNHLGDWGLQIGMVLADLHKRAVDLDHFTVAQLEKSYRSATLDCKADHAALEAAKKYNMGPHRIIECEEQVKGAEIALSQAKETLLRLQNGDEAVVSDWRKIIKITLADCYEICALLDLQLTEEHERGESFYRKMLPEVVREFEDSGIAEVDAGALIVRTEESETPLIIRKSDGGFLYATTDLAGIRYRVRELGAERVIYVVDARQRDHFKLVFAACRLIGYDIIPKEFSVKNEHAQLVHLPFGAVCGNDRKPLKTRDGDNVKLRDLLTEAIERAKAIVHEKNPDLSDEEKNEVARAVGIGAVKYADLSAHFGRDYIFDWNRMLAFEGNTGAYLQNQFVRIQSILRKAGEANYQYQDAEFVFKEDAERSLAMILLRYPTTVGEVAQTLEPHRLCQYLYGLANAYSVFYTKCPVLKADSENKRASRLRLCYLTARVLGDGLHLLGLRTLNRM